MVVNHENRRASVIQSLSRLDAQKKKLAFDLGLFELEQSPRWVTDLDITYLITRFRLSKRLWNGIKANATWALEGQVTQKLLITPAADAVLSAQAPLPVDRHEIRFHRCSCRSSPSCGRHASCN